MNSMTQVYVALVVLACFAVLAASHVLTSFRPSWNTLVFCADLDRHGQLEEAAKYLEEMEK